VSFGIQCKRLVVCCLVMVVVGSWLALCHNFFFASVDSSSDGSCHCVCSHRYASQLACCRDGRDAVTFAMSIACRWLLCCSSKRLQVDNIMDDGCFLWSHNNICSVGRWPSNNWWMFGVYGMVVIERVRHRHYHCSD
jgi:hypothetical protein